MSPAPRTIWLAMRLGTLSTAIRIRQRTATIRLRRRHTGSRSISACRDPLSATPIRRAMSGRTIAGRRGRSKARTTTRRGRWSIRSPTNRPSPSARNDPTSATRHRPSVTGGGTSRPRRGISGTYAEVGTLELWSGASLANSILSSAGVSRSQGTGTVVAQIGQLEGFDQPAYLGGILKSGKSHNDRHGGNVGERQG